jgi:rhodanese-related sulfurtransferase
MTVCEDMFSRVLEIPPASPKEAQRYFLNKLTSETDPSDVHTDIVNKKNDFVLVDVRSSEAYQSGHAQGAIHIPHNDMTAKRMTEFLKDQVFVVYCWGPGCNGATKAALKLSRLGFAVKEMIGGIEYWEKEGYPIAKN